MFAVCRPVDRTNKCYLEVYLAHTRAILSAKASRLGLAQEAADTSALVNAVTSKRCVCAACNAQQCSCRHQPNTHHRVSVCVPKQARGPVNFVRSQPLVEILSLFSLFPSRVDYYHTLHVCTTPSFLFSWSCRVVGALLSVTLVNEASWAVS